MHCIRSSLYIVLGHHYIIKIKHSISMTGRYVKTPEVLGGYKVYTMNEGTYNQLNLSTFIEVPVPTQGSQRPCICVDFDSVSTFYLLEFGTVPTV